jgi:hypothetical protein
MIDVSWAEHSLGIPVQIVAEPTGVTKFMASQADICLADNDMTLSIVFGAAV